MCYCLFCFYFFVLFFVLRSVIVDRISFVVREKETCGIMTCGMNNLEIDYSLFSHLM